MFYLVLGVPPPSLCFAQVILHVLYKRFLPAAQYKHKYLEIQLISITANFD